MPDSRLRIYLDDHLAFIVGELELARRCRGSNRGTPLGEFLERYVLEVQAQQAIVEDLLQRIGGGGSSLKRRAAWLAEKLGRFKLNDALFSYSPLSRLVELETLSSAAQSRASLWNALELLAGDERFVGITFSYFVEQTAEQLQELHARRRYAASLAFASEH